MKKIFFLLLCTVASYGQVSTGQEQEFDYGIKNNASQTVTMPYSIVTQGADGTQGKSTFIVQDIKNKAYLSTGLLKNGLITINADPTKFNVSAGIGIISNFDDPTAPTSTLINFPAFTGVTPAYLLTGNITYIAVNSTPAIVMQASPFTESQRRDLIILGAVIHSNLTTINVINNISAPSNAIGNQLHDFIEAVGALNLTGNKYSANGANLLLDKSAGTIFKFGVNFANDWKNPHQLSQGAGTGLTFRYRTQNGTEGSDVASISPGFYDNANVITAVPNNKFTIQTVTIFQTGLTRIQYGQQVYDDLASAKNAIFTRNYIPEANIKENGITRAYIVLRNSTTSLQNAADCEIIEAQKFGGVASGGVALTFANIVSALGYTPESVANKATNFSIVNNTLYPSVQAVKTYADGLVVGLLDDRGSYNASSNLFPTTGGSGTAGAIFKGDIWYVGTAGTLGGKAVSIGDSFRALVDTPGQTASNWSLLSSNLSYVPANDANVIHTTGNETKTGSLTATSFTKSGATSTNILLAGGGDISQSTFHTGTLTTNFIPKATGASTLGNSQIFDNGTNVGIGTTSPTSAKVQATSSSTTMPVGYFYNPNTTAGTSKGLVIEGGTNSTDYSLSVANSSGINKFLIDGLGNVKVASLSGSGNVSVQSDNSGYLFKGSSIPLRYKALISQSGTSAPTVVVLENTIGAISWTRTAVGSYSGTLTGAFVANKTYFSVKTGDIVTGFGTNVDIYQNTASPNVAQIFTVKGAGGSDDILINAPLLIEVYP